MLHPIFITQHKSFKMRKYICGLNTNECVLSKKSLLHFRAFANYKESEKKKKIVSN